MTRRTALNTLLTVGGVALLVWQVQANGGISSVKDGLSRVGFGFLPILAISFARFVLRSHAWLILLNDRAPLSAAVAATISGDALGNLTPLSLAASEPAKAVYLGRRVDTTQAFAALAAENFFYTVSIAIYIVIGAAAMLGTFEHLPTEIRMAGIAALALMAIGLVIAAWVAWERPALVSNVLSRLPSPRLAVWIDRVRDFETRAYGSGGPGTGRLVWLALTETAFHVLSFAESWLTLYLVTGRSQPLEALILDSVSRAINVVFKAVPFRTGVDEVTAETVALAIGLLPGTGLVTALVRKVRMLVWAAVGLAIWFLRGSENAAVGEKQRGQ